MSPGWRGQRSVVIALLTASTSEFPPYSAPGARPGEAGLARRREDVIFGHAREINALLVVAVVLMESHLAVNGHSLRRFFDVPRPVGMERSQHARDVVLESQVVPQVEHLFRDLDNRQAVGWHMVLAGRVEYWPREAVV